jgi:hypothetical protein
MIVGVPTNDGDDRPLDSLYCFHGDVFVRSQAREGQNACSLLVAGFRPKGEELEIENAISRERDLTKARLNGFGVEHADGMVWGRAKS